MKQLRLEASSKLVEIEDIFRDYNLPSVNKITLIARDPARPNMYILLTNDNLDDVMDLIKRDASVGHG